MNTAVPRPLLENALQLGASLFREVRAAWEWTRDEARRMRPVFLFFLTGFLLVLLIVKLSLAQYSIPVSALSRALLGAVLAAKVVLILEHTRLGRLFRYAPRIVDILSKSVLYGASVIILGCAERISEGFHKTRSIGAAFATVLAHSEIHRLLAVALGVSLVFAAYFAVSDISEVMGEGGMGEFFLKPRGQPRDRLAEVKD
jgi:hypothetical protein